MTAAVSRQALRALLACPTGSIGCLGDDNVKAVMQDFPLAIEDGATFGDAVLLGHFIERYDEAAFAASTAR